MRTIVDMFTLDTVAFQWMTQPMAMKLIAIPLLVQVNQDAFM